MFLSFMVLFDLPQVVTGDRLLKGYCFTFSYFHFLRSIFCYKWIVGLFFVTVYYLV